MPRTGPVLAIFAHPDDAEICAGGALAKWAATGREVHLLILTNGDRGSGDPRASRGELAATRRRETEEAAEVLGSPAPACSRRTTVSSRTRASSARRSPAGSARCAPRRP